MAYCSRCNKTDVYKLFEEKKKRDAEAALKKEQELAAQKEQEEIIETPVENKKEYIAPLIEIIEEQKDEPEIELESEPIFGIEKDESEGGDVE